MKKRDIAFSRKLANQARSGIMFVGEEHLASLTNLLEIQCKEVAAGGTVPEGPVEIEDIEEM